MSHSSLKTFTNYARDSLILRKCPVFIYKYEPIRLVASNKKLI